jgi:2-polyprenyl-3-methyl-5-hydroxy-6-metoxy-1,4-benzoquinol methylase
MEEIGLVYYGYVFDASGYGNAARSYIHAMHKAGIRISVVDLANRGRQVHDSLVESLQNKPVEADFHLFHGIPPQWARLAFKQPRGIGMTVWETDVMPTQWRNALNQMLEVWLPCEFNVTAFGKSLERPVFRLPHPMGSCSPNGFHGTLDFFEAIPRDDFIFYSIFEWQDRKCPQGLLTTFLRTFSAADRTTLIIKTNPGAVGAAHAALEQARNTVRSDARVVIYPEGWSDTQIAALHARADCYISLHRGEGWNCPLFEAACKGKPVIATAYSGPMDYLSPSAHMLVRYKNCPVRQPYLYYNPNMQWADPDLDHASELMRQVYEHPEESRALAQRAAPPLRDSFSPRSVGEMAKARLSALLRRTRPDRWRTLPKKERAAELAPSIPIPGDWYDGDYFETGQKSNWTNGYNWPSFSGLFRDTARFLMSIFPEAQSFLDAGCAKGFLVRCLREEGKDAWGFDASPWAIRNADRSCVPFLELDSVDTHPFNKKFDIVLAFSLLESLTENQIQSFLVRSRRAAQSAILAVICTLDSQTPELQFPQEDIDLSHITLRSRRWWDEQFLRAGWQRNNQRNDLQERCQSHALPVRMGWKVFCYANDSTKAE